MRFVRINLHFWLIKRLVVQDQHDVMCPVSYRDIVPRDDSKHFTIVRREDAPREAAPSSSLAGFITAGGELLSSKLHSVTITLLCAPPIHNRRVKHGVP